MKSDANAKRRSLNFAAWSIGYIALGLVLLLAPDHGRQILCLLVGVGIIILGIGRIAWYFAKDDVSRAFHNDIPYGIILLILGIYIIAKPESVFGLLPVILGFSVVFDSMVKLQHSFDLKRTGFVPWWGVLVGSLVTAVLGVLLILGVIDQTILLYYFGAVLLLDGAFNLIIIALLSWRLRKKKQTPPEDPPEAQ